MLLNNYLKMFKKKFFKFLPWNILKQYFVAFFMLHGVAFSNSSMTFHSTLVWSNIRWPTLFLQEEFFSFFLNLSWPVRLPYLEIMVYWLLVFTKSVDINFRTFWLAPLTRNILGYSLFWKRKEKWRVISRKFQKKKLKQHFYPSVW